MLPVFKKSKVGPPYLYTPAYPPILLQSHLNSHP